jgi:hypothetical protein
MVQAFKISGGQKEDDESRHRVNGLEVAGMVTLRGNVFLKE